MTFLNTKHFLTLGFHAFKHGSKVQLSFPSPPSLSAQDLKCIAGLVNKQGLFRVRLYGVVCLLSSPAIHLRSCSGFIFFTNVHVKKAFISPAQNYHLTLLTIACLFSFPAFLQSHPCSANKLHAKAAPSYSPTLIFCYSALSHP